MRHNADVLGEQAEGDECPRCGGERDDCTCPPGPPQGSLAGNHGPRCRCAICEVVERNR